MGGSQGAGTRNHTSMLKNTAKLEKINKERKVEYDMPQKPNAIDRGQHSYSPINETKNQRHLETF